MGPLLAIVTTRANSLLAPIHDRMPVVLDEDDWATWLDPAVAVAVAVADAARLAALLAPAPDDWLEVYAVSPRVNSPRNNDADLVRRVDPAPDPA